MMSSLFKKIFVTFLNFKRITNKKMTYEDIQEINKKCPDDQGIFKEPSMIPVDVKDYVIYKRVETGGMTGGDCWGDEAYSYGNKNESEFVVLDLVLEKLKPSITYFQYKKISKLIHTNEETEEEYYGNSADYKVEYIILEELEKFLSEL